MGGSGKTRLALHVAGDLVEQFKSRVYLIALASISDPGMVPTAIAESMGISQTGGRAFLDLLKVYLRDNTAPALLLFCLLYTSPSPRD